MCLFDESNIVNNAILIHLSKCPIVMLCTLSPHSPHSIIAHFYSDHDSSIINTNDSISSGLSPGLRVSEIQRATVRVEQWSASQHGGVKLESGKYCNTRDGSKSELRITRGRGRGLSDRGGCGKSREGDRDGDDSRPSPAHFRLHHSDHRCELVIMIASKN